MLYTSYLFLNKLFIFLGNAVNDNGEHFHGALK